MNSLKRDDVVTMLKAISDTMAENKDYLCSLDAQMGDGDLGLTMSKGWSAAAQAAQELDEPDIGKLLVKTGMKMSSAVPSTMGTLMASGLMSAGKALTGKAELGSAELADFLQGFCDGIVKRGRCQPGDRTVLDSLWGAAQAAKAGAELPLAQAAEKALAGAQTGLESTRQMTPKFGKAAVFAAKAIGTVDQGAVVGLLIVQSIHKAIAGAAE